MRQQQLLFYVAGFGLGFLVGSLLATGRRIPRDLIPPFDAFGRVTDPDRLVHWTPAPLSGYEREPLEYSR